MFRLRETAAGAAVLVGIALAAGVQGWPVHGRAFAVAAPLRDGANASRVTSGPGFAVCRADERRHRAFDLGSTAVLYDGRDPDGPSTCWSQQPQVLLFGYEPVMYDAQAPATAVLRVRRAPGYRMVVLTGPIRSRIDVVADRKLDELVVPAVWVTPVR